MSLVKVFVVSLEEPSLRKEPSSEEMLSRERNSAD